MRKLVLTLLAAAACLPLAAPATRADTTGFVVTNPTNVGGYSNRDRTDGYTFTLANPISLTQLGAYDYQANGLGSAETVTIWNSMGNPVATATVPAGVGILDGGFIYTTLGTAVTLSAGTYTVGLYTAGNSDPAFAYTTLTSAAGVTYGASRSGNGNAYPTSDAYFGGQPNGFFGPNFQFNAIGGGSIPEPGTWATVGLGAGVLGVMALRRRHRRADRPA